MTNDEKIVGFIFSYKGYKEIQEQKPISGLTEINFNHLLSKLNRKYPELFPFTNWKNYKITNAYDSNQMYDKSVIKELNNLQRIKNQLDGLSMVICLGETAYFAAKNVVKEFNLPIQIIKTKNLHCPASRHIKTLQQNIKRTRTNYQIIELFNELDKELHINFENSY